MIQTELTGFEHFVGQSELKEIKSLWVTSCYGRWVFKVVTEHVYFKLLFITGKKKKKKSDGMVVCNAFGLN